MNEEKVRKISRAGSILSLLALLSFPVTFLSLLFFLTAAAAFVGLAMGYVAYKKDRSLIVRFAFSLTVGAGALLYLLYTSYLNIPNYLR